MLGRRLRAEFVARPFSLRFGSADSFIDGGLSSGNVFRLYAQGNGFARTAKFTSTPTACPIRLIERLAG